MDERKEFFRQLGLPRFEVYDYAVRSFETPSFDLDYFEYRRHNLQKQNLSEDIIKRQLLNEVRNSFQEPTGSSQLFNRKISTPPPPIIRDFLPLNNDIEKNTFSSQRMSNNQGYQKFGSNFGNNDYFGNNMNSQRTSSNQSFQQSGSGFSRNNDFQRMSSNQGFQQTESNFNNVGNSFCDNMNSQRMSTNQNFQQNSSNFANNNSQFGNNMNSQRMSGNQGFQQTGTSFGSNSDWFGNNQNSQRAGPISFPEKQIQSAQFGVGSSNWNQNAMQNNTTNWGQNSLQSTTQSNWSASWEQNNSSRNLQSQRSQNNPARGPTSGKDRNPPARQNPPTRNSRSRQRRGQNSSERTSQSKRGETSRKARPVQQKPTTSQRASLSKPNQRQKLGNKNFNESLPSLMSNFSNNFNNRGNFNEPNFFANNSMNTDFNNFPVVEPSLEDQVSGIVVQALQHISNTINQPINKKGLRTLMKAQKPQKRKAVLPGDGNPFLKQRSKSFEKQFKKFDCCILLTRRPKTDREDLSKGLSFLKNIKKRPLAALEDDATTAAKRRKQNNEEEQTDETQEDTSKTETTENAENLENSTANEVKEEQEEEEEGNDGNEFTLKRRKRDSKSLSQKKVENFTKSSLPEGRPEEFIQPEIYGDDLTKMPKRYSFKDYAIWFKQYRWVKDHVMKVEDTDPALKKIFFFSMHAPRKINNDKLIECEKTIEKALKIQEENLMHKEAYEFLKARTQYAEFLYVFKKAYLSHDGLRCLQKIYDHLLTANIVGFYKGIIEKFALTYGKNGCEAKKPKNKELLADKAFHWLVGNAFRELKRMFNRTKLNERLNELHKLGCFIDKRAVENAKLLFKNPDYAHKDINELDALIEKQPEINWKNCRQFMRLELLAVNDLYNKFLEDEAIEKRKIVLEKLKTEPYVEKVHMYMAQKLLNIFERIKFLESIHPRMIARQDLKQLIAFRKFLAVEDLKLMVKHILDQWLKKYGHFTNQKYRELFPNFPTFKSDGEADNNEEEDDEELHDNEDEHDNDNDGNEKNEDMQMEHENEEIAETKEKESDTVDLVTDDDDEKQVENDNVKVQTGKIVADSKAKRGRGIGGAKTGK